MIRPLKDKIKIIEAKIHQKQAENLVDPSSETNDKKPIIMKKNNIDAYSLIENTDSVDSTVHTLA